jgi:hypothetical protein
VHLMRQAWPCICSKGFLELLVLQQVLWCMFLVGTEQWRDAMHQ